MGGGGFLFLDTGGDDVYFKSQISTLELFHLKVTQG